MEKILSAIETRLRKAKGKEKKRLLAYRAALKLEVAKLRYTLREREGRVLSRTTEKVIVRAQVVTRRWTLEQQRLWFLLNTSGELLVGFLALARQPAQKESAPFLENLLHKRQEEEKPTKENLKLHATPLKRSGEWHLLRRSRPELLGIDTAPKPTLPPFQRHIPVKLTNTLIPEGFVVTKCPAASVVPKPPSSGVSWIAKAERLQRNVRL